MDLAVPGHVRARSRQKVADSQSSNKLRTPLLRPDRLSPDLDRVVQFRCRLPLVSNEDDTYTTALSDSRNQEPDPASAARTEIYAVGRGGQEVTGDTPVDVLCEDLVRERSRDGCCGAQVGSCSISAAPRAIRERTYHPRCYTLSWRDLWPSTTPLQRSPAPPDARCSLRGTHCGRAR